MFATLAIAMALGLASVGLTTTTTADSAAGATGDSLTTAAISSESEVDLLELILEKAIGLKSRLQKADAPAGFYPRHQLLPVGTLVWSNISDISCAWEGDFPTAADSCWSTDDYQSAKIIEIVEDRPGGPVYKIMYEPLPGRSAMPQSWADINEVFEGYNLPEDVKNFSNILVRTNW